MKIPDDKVVITDDEEIVVAGDVPDDSEEKEEKVDDTTEEKVTKKEEEQELRMKRLEEGNKKLMEMFVSPEFFAKLGNSMKPAPAKVVKAEPTTEEVQAEKDKLEAMDRREFLSHALSKVSTAAVEAIKPEINKLATQMSTFITGQATVAGDSAVQDFIGRVGQAEFDKFGATMEAKANVTKGLSMDDLYELASGKKAPKYAQSVIPNKTIKPGEGLKVLTEQKDLSMDDASSRNFDHIFAKYKK